MDPMNKKRTMSVFEKLKQDGAPKPQYVDSWTDKPLPEEEASEQEQFDEDMKRRIKQSQINKMSMPRGLDEIDGIKPGPLGTNAPGTGAGSSAEEEAGAVPYAQKYFQRRRQFRRPTS